MIYAIEFLQKWQQIKKSSYTTYAINWFSKLYLINIPHILKRNY